MTLTPTVVSTKTSTPTPTVTSSPTTTPTHTFTPTMVPTFTSVPKSSTRLPKGWKLREAFQDFVDTKGVFEIDGKSHFMSGFGWHNDRKEIELNDKVLRVFEPSQEFDNIDVILADQKILSMRCAQDYAIYGTNVISLYEYENHWLMEVMCNKTTDIFFDGQSLNDVNGYSASFSPYFISGKLFYFFYRTNAVGFNYDGLEYPLDYDFIYYYHCCGISEANPIFYTDHIEFHAVRGGDGSNQDNAKHRYNVVMGVAQ